MIYVSMTGAKHTLGQQAAMSHNLANANTTGYRAETSVLRAVPILGNTLTTRDSGWIPALARNSARLPSSIPDVNST